MAIRTRSIAGFVTLLGLASAGTALGDITIHSAYQAYQQDVWCNSLPYAPFPFSDTRSDSTNHIGPWSVSSEISVPPGPQPTSRVNVEMDMSTSGITLSAATFAGFEGSRFPSMTEGSAYTFYEYRIEFELPAAGLVELNSAMSGGSVYFGAYVDTQLSTASGTTIIHKGTGPDDRGDDILEASIEFLEWLPAGHYVLRGCTKLPVYGATDLFGAGTPDLDGTIDLTLRVIPGPASVTLLGLAGLALPSRRRR